MSSMMQDPVFYIALFIGLVVVTVIPIVAVRFVASREDRTVLPPKRPRPALEHPASYQPVFVKAAPRSADAD